MLSTLARPWSRSDLSPVSAGRGWRAPGLVFLLAGTIAFAGGLDPAWAQSMPKKGGVLRVAVLGDPPTLDSHWTTANFVEVITQHIYEGLYTLDQSYQPIPDLAEALPQVSADGLVYTIKLRQGIKFHNGKEMTSDDVVASLNRWGGYAVQAKALWASVEDVRPAGKYAIELRLKEKSGVVLISLANANNFAAIYPKEIAEKYPTPNKVTEFIGTGPYKFVEWKPDSHIRMVRFDDYKPRPEAPTAGAGERSPTSTRSAGSRRRTSPRASPPSNRATSTSPTISSPTRSTGSRRMQGSSPSWCGRFPGPSASSTRRKA